MTSCSLSIPISGINEELQTVVWTRACLKMDFWTYLLESRPELSVYRPPS